MSRRGAGLDREGLGRLLVPLLPLLARWTHRRFPGKERVGLDTSELVQTAVAEALQRSERLVLDNPQSLRNYLEKAIKSRFLNRVHRDRKIEPLTREDLEADSTFSPLEEAIQAEEVEKLSEALAGLSEAERELLRARFERGMRWSDIAEATGKSSPSAARMATKRALAQLRRLLR